MDISPMISGASAGGDIVARPTTNAKEVGQRVSIEETFCRRTMQPPTGPNLVTEKFADRKMGSGTGAGMFLSLNLSVLKLFLWSFPKAKVGRTIEGRMIKTKSSGRGCRHRVACGGFGWGTVVHGDLRRRRRAGAHEPGMH